MAQAAPGGKEAWKKLCLCSGHYRVAKEAERSEKCGGSSGARWIEYLFMNTPGIREETLGVTAHQPQHYDRLIG